MTLDTTAAPTDANMTAMDELRARCVESISGQTVEIECTALLALLDELAALRSAQQWRGIESAPRDGTVIILYGPYPEGEGLTSARVTAGFWLVPEPEKIGDCGGPCRCPEYSESDEPPFWSSIDGGFIDSWPATHWMPLPDAPLPETGGDQ